jgi:hypothetical protein
MFVVPEGNCINAINLLERLFSPDGQTWIDGYCARAHIFRRRMNDRLQHLALFERTVESGSFSKAAREFTLSQPSRVALDLSPRAKVGG